MGRRRCAQRPQAVGLLRQLRLVGHALPREAPRTAAQRLAERRNERHQVLGFGRLRPSGRYATGFPRHLQQVQPAFEDRFPDQQVGYALEQYVVLQFELQFAGRQRHRQYAPLRLRPRAGLLSDAKPRRVVALQFALPDLQDRQRPPHHAQRGHAPQRRPLERLLEHDTPGHHAVQDAEHYGRLHLPPLSGTQHEQKFAALLS